MSWRSGQLSILSMVIRPQGPDGYNSAFYQQNWDLVSSDLVDAIKQFFSSGYLLKDGIQQPLLWFLRLIPLPLSKIIGPIACYNVTYKCISKIHANRLQHILPKIISPCQSAFNKGRSNVDNVLLMQELVKDYHKDQGSPRCAMKLDLMKAYDSVSWQFLFEAMAAMHFPEMFIQWTKQCVIVINGELQGYFAGARGLRHSLPFSDCHGSIILYLSVQNLP